MTITAVQLLQAIAFLAVLLAVEGVYLFFRSQNVREKAVNRRMKLAAANNQRVLNPEIFRQTIAGGPFSALASQLMPGLERLIWRSAIGATPLQFFSVTGGAFVFLFILFSSVLRAPTLLSLIVAGSFGIALPFLVLNLKAAGRLKKFNEQLPMAIDIMVRGLQAGHPVPVAIEMVAREVQDPIGSEFGHALDQMNYGRERGDAMRDIADRFTSPEFLFLVSSIEMQKETGGNLAEILSNLSKVIRERATMRKKVVAMSAEGRISCFVVGGLPFLMALAIMLLNPAFFLDVREDPLFWPMIGGGFALWAIGITWIWRMVNFKF